MIEIAFMALTLFVAGRFVNKGIYPLGAFTSSSAFLIGSWFFIVFNAFLTKTGHAHEWGKVLLVEYPSLYTESALIAVIGTVFFTFGAYFSRQPTTDTSFAIIPLTKKDKTILVIVGIVFFIPGNWAAVYAYNEALLTSFWDRTTSIATISNLIIPAALIGVIGVITSVKKGLGSLLFFGIILVASISGLLLLWSRRAILGIVFVLVMVLYAKKYGTPSKKILYFLFPVLASGAILLAFYRAFVFFDASTENLTILDILDQYLTHIWLESSSFATLMYSAGPATENELLYGSSFLAAFVFYIPRVIFPDKPFSYDLGLVIGDLKYNLPASFYGETIANFGILAVPVVAFILGYCLKKIDYQFYSKPRDVFEVGIYLLFAFNMFFMVRGSFSTVVSAAVIMCLLPLIAYYILSKITTRKKETKIHVEV